MKKRVFFVLILCLTAVLSVSVLAGGGSDDPLVTLSYLNKIYTEPMDAALKTRIDAASQQVLDRVNTAYSAAMGRLSADRAGLLADAAYQRVAEKVLADPSLLRSSGVRTVALRQGDKIAGPPGAGIILQSGTGKICGPASAVLVNITASGTRQPGAAIAANVYYMTVANDGSGIEITSKTATAMLMDGARVVTSYTAQNTKYADALSSMGLFLGTNNGYELSRTPTRQEALIMLIRLFGEEKQALAHSADSSFTDVTGWIDGRRYIAYAEKKNYTNGVAPGRFDQYGDSSIYMYLTYVLRALGYSDATGDFVWNTTSGDLAVSLGLLTQAQLNSVSSSGFMRDHVVLISCNALSVPLKDGSRTLGAKLIADGVITQQQLWDAIASIQ